MGKTVEYQGYTIQSSPEYDANWTKWRLRIFISVEDHHGLRSRQFSSEVLHRTEQEAEVKGITFGQRLINGELEGRSIGNIKTTDRRVMPRVRVQFQTMFSDSTQLEGIGIMFDVSMGAQCCRKYPTVHSTLWTCRHLPKSRWPMSSPRKA